MTDGMKSVLLLGQSNMAGRGSLDAVEAISDDRIFMLRNGSWVKMAEPIHDDKPSVAGVGLGASFAKGFVESFDTELGLIPGAFGGTSLADWTVGGEYYTRALNMAKAAQTTSDICAILWHQGESDQSNANYEAELKVILDAFITDLGLDPEKVVIITGELGEFRGNAANGVNTALAALSDDYANYGVASAKDLLAQDVTTHFDSPSLRVFGYRYFSLFYNLVTGKTFTYDDNVESYRVTPEEDEGEVDTSSYISYVDFNGSDYSTDTVYTSALTIGNQKYTTSNGSISFAYESGSTEDKYLVLNRTSSSAKPYADISGSITAGSTVVVEASFKVGAGSGAAADLLKLVATVSGSTVSMPLVYVDTDGKLYDCVSGTKGEYLGASLSEHEWSRVKVVVHLDTNTKDIYLNGSDTPVLTGVTLSTGVSDLTTYAPSKVRVGQFKAGTTGELHVDDYCCYYLE